MKSICFVFGVVLAASASAQITPKAGGYLFRMKFRPGVTRYNTAINQVTTGGKGIGVAMPFAQTVLKVAKGKATMAVKSGPFMINGRPFGTPQITTPFEVNALGRGSNGEAGGQGLTAMPQNPVKVGAKWSSSLTVATMSSTTATTKATYQFVRLTKYRGQDVAELATTLVSDRGGEISGKGVTLLSAKDGTIVKSTLRMNFGATGTDGKPVSMQFDVVITRQ